MCKQLTIEEEDILEREGKGNKLQGEGAEGRAGRGWGWGLEEEGVLYYLRRHEIVGRVKLSPFFPRRQKRTSF